MLTYRDGGGGGGDVPDLLYHMCSIGHENNITLSVELT